MPFAAGLHWPALSTKHTTGYPLSSGRPQSTMSERELEQFIQQTQQQVQLQQGGAQMADM